MLSKLESYAIAALAALLLTFFFLWKGATVMASKAAQELVTVNDELRSAKEANDRLTKELQLRSDLNEKLSGELSASADRYAADTGALKDRISTLEKQPDKTVVVNKIVYVKEAYVKEATQAVAESLWTNYCRAHPCQGSVQ